MGISIPKNVFYILKRDIGIHASHKMSLCANKQIRAAMYPITCKSIYRKISYLRRTKFQNLNASRLGLQLSLCNILTPGVMPIMKMWLEQHRQAMLQLHLSDQQLYCQLGCALYKRFLRYCMVAVEEITAVLRSTRIIMIVVIIFCSILHEFLWSESIMWFMWNRTALNPRPQ